MFSPMVAIRWVSSSATRAGRCRDSGAALSASTSSPTVERQLGHLARRRPGTVSLRATKSVSAFTSTMAPRGRRGGDADQPLGGDAAGLLGGRRQALLAQPVDRGLQVAAGLGQRLLAVHHARAGLLAQVLDQGGGDLGHVVLSCFGQLRLRRAGCSTAGSASRPRSGSASGGSVLGARR